MPPKFADRFRQTVSSASSSSALLSESADFTIESNRHLPKSLHRSAPAPSEFAVVRASDIRRIRNAISEVKHEDEFELREKQRLADHLKSLERSKMWPDTLENQREIKIRKSKERTETEEEERLKIDREESLYQEELKREMNEKAWKMLQQQSVGMRQLQSKQLLCDVLEERDAQKELAKQIEERRKREHDEWVQKEKERAKQEAEKLNGRDTVSLQKKIDYAKALEEQQHEIVKKAIEEKKKAIEEKKQIEDLVQKATQEEQAKLQEKRSRNVQALEETRILDEMKKEIESRKDENEQREYETSLKYVERKNRIETRRKEMERKEIQKREDRNQYLLDNYHETAAQKRAAEEERLAKYNQEKEEEWQRRREQEEQKRIQTNMELDQAHQFQLAQKHRKKQSTKEHEQKVKEIIEGQYEEARLEEEIIEQAKVQKAQKINQFNSNQKAQRDHLGRQAREEELRQDMLISESIQLGDKAVEQYVSSMTQKLALEGKQTSPMRRIDPGYRIIIPS